MILALLAAACGPRQGEIPAEWRSLYAADVSVEGTWMMTADPGLDYRLLRIQRLEGTRFDLEDGVGTDIGPRRESYGATWSGTALVPERYAASRGALFPVRIDGREGLLPGGWVAAREPEKRTPSASADLVFWRVEPETFEEYLRPFVVPH